MDLRAHQSWSPAVRSLVARAAGLTDEQLVDFGGFESFVFRAPHPSGPGFLKATWNGRRTPEQILAELHFVEHLADHGARVARPLPFPGGAMVVTVPGELDAFHLSWFAEVPGSCLRTDPWSISMITGWGATLGRMHRLARSYPGPPAGCARSPWDTEYAVATEGDDPELLHASAAVVAQVAELPRSAETFGPMHGDPHHNNIHWDRGVAWVFDFDDMMDFWFVSDLAVALFYETMRAGPTHAQRLTAFRRALTPLLTGYVREHTLDEAQLGQLPLFMKLREVDLRAAVLRSVSPERRTDWHTRFLTESADRLRGGQPALGIQMM